MIKLTGKTDQHDHLSSLGQLGQKEPAVAYTDPAQATVGTELNVLLTD